MSEVTLEVPARYAGQFQEMLGDFVSDARRALDGTIDRSGQHAAYFDAQRRAVKEIPPLLSQGAAQDGNETITFDGSSEWVLEALEFLMGYRSEELWGLMEQHLVDHEKAREYLAFLGWLNDAAETVEGTHREAVAA